MNKIETKGKDISKLVPAVLPSNGSIGGIKQGKEIVLNKDKLPLNIVYKGRRYVLILTKNDKLILNKNTD